MSLLGTAAAWLIDPPDESVDGTSLSALRPADPALDASRRSRAGAWPIAPPDEEPFAALVPAARTAGLTRIAVLGPPAAVAALAAAVALSCRTRARVPAALVAHWPAPGAGDRLPGPGGGPVLPGAAALASRLSRRDLPVAARGRIVWLRLPDDDAAVATLRRAEAAIGDLPAVLAVARPRDVAVDAALADRDLLILAADDDSALAAAAADDISALGVPARLCRPVPPGASRLAALAGLRGPRLEPIAASPSRTQHPAPRVERAW